MSRFEEIKLTPEQEDCVDYEGKDLIVKGVAGGGKSIVLLRRALKINEKALDSGDDTKVVIFTYIKTLKHNISEIIDGYTNGEHCIKVEGVDSYCMRLYKELTGKSSVWILGQTDKKEKNKVIEKVLEEVQLKRGDKHRFYKIEPDFWADEFKWIKEKYIKTVDEYISSDRHGRGSRVRMSDEDKKLAFSFFECFQGEVEKAGKIEYDDIYTGILDNRDNIDESYMIDYSLIDEAQDLSFAKLSVIKLLTRKNMTIAADQAQKIYNTSFTWKELGIDVNRSNSKSLNKSFRSTKQIVTLADNLLKNNKIPQLVQEYTRPVIPDIEGPLPVVISYGNELQKKMQFINVVKKLMKSSPEECIGILYRSYKDKDKIKKWLKDAGTRYESIYGDKGWSLFKPGIKLCTYHSAKGLEFDTVIIPCLEDDIIPIIPSNCEEEQVEELLEKERCILYVGMTRAKQNLIMMYAGVPSRFVDEMDSSLYKTV